MFRRKVLGIFLVALFLAGCQSDKDGQILGPKEFVKITSGQTSTNMPPGSTAKPKLISPGMVISITVAQDQTLDRQYVVPNSGAIEYPPLGRIAIDGLTTDELATAIRKGLEKDYFRKATVHVDINSVTGTGGGVIYVIGNVNRPGPLLIPKNERFTVTKAILAAGGLAQFANGAKVQVVRYASNGKKYRTYINVTRIMKEGDFEKDIDVKNGDWIIVPEKLINF